MKQNDVPHGNSPGWDPVWGHDLKDIVARIADSVTELDAHREWALSSSREIIRMSASLIMSCHRGAAPDELLRTWEVIHDLVLTMNERCGRTGSLIHAGFVEDAQAEASEAAIVVGIIMERASMEDASDQPISPGKDLPRCFPSPEDIGVKPTPYLKGLGDVMGELRRFTLEHLRTGDTAAAEWFYGIMEEIYSLLVGLPYSHVSSDLRKKMDTGRVLLERTLGELVNVKHMASLERSLRGSSGTAPPDG